MHLGRTLLRIVVGWLFVAHGAQKLFGKFGGHGPDGTGQFFETLGLHPGKRNAVAAGASELGGGALFAAGLLTPLGASLISGSMVIAMRTVHFKNGPWAAEGGYEYNLVLIALVFAIADVGPGPLSLDHALGLDLSGTGWALAELAAALAASAAVMAAARAAAPAETPAADAPAPAA